MPTCEHLVFPRKQGNALRTCSRNATWWFYYSYPREPGSSEMCSGRTALCTKHRNAQLAEEDAGRHMSGNTIPDPWVPMADGNPDNVVGTTPTAQDRIDRIDRDGNITEHRLHPTKPARTLCGAKLDGMMTQSPAGNRRCRNCFPRGD